jgi:hypothetical protein
VRLQARTSCDARQLRPAVQQLLRSELRQQQLPDVEQFFADV